MGELDIDCEAVPRQLARFIRDFLSAAGFARGVLGLSGGLDSTVSVYLAAEALGPENVLGLILPYKTTEPSCCDDATTVVERLGIHSQVLDITPQIDAYFEHFPEADRIRRGNKLARERMSIIYDQAKAWNALVVGTGNKTEGLLGYTTLWGDMACDLNPLGSLYKAQVRQLARHLGVPPRILHKTPSGNLWPGQTDEGEMGVTYEDADRILYRLVDLNRSPEQIVVDGFERALVDKIRSMVQGAEHKRRMPPVCPIGARAET